MKRQFSIICSREVFKTCLAYFSYDAFKAANINEKQESVFKATKTQ